MLVENDEVASRFIEGLRRYNLGRATFVPLNRLQPMPDAEVPQGWVHHGVGRVRDGCRGGGQNRGG